MILIPEIETVMILVPRTGSGSLRHAIAERYPKSFMIYRHMEANMVPFGYDRWRKIGVVREPVNRLWSLFKFLHRAPNVSLDPTYVERMSASVRGTNFNDWLLTNEAVFTSPFKADGSYVPNYAINIPMPENRKSQWHYLRPDLGTEIWRYPELPTLEKKLDIKLGEHNVTLTDKRWSQLPPSLTDAAKEHVLKWFKWDIQMTHDYVLEAA